MHITIHTYVHTLFRLHSPLRQGAIDTRGVASVTISGILGDVMFSTLAKNARKQGIRFLLLNAIFPISMTSTVFVPLPGFAPNLSCMCMSVHCIYVRLSIILPSVKLTISAG